ncbi:type II secretion system protein GspL [Endozoicomonas ascidiicola]|uniref:type II secretion system protein GspL n=1 Tax=Endozoicomonas ascidiicola TaxID=1698521 RepID=UPI00082B9F1A|nr:type II secretion system protein GspL [Endozoicomonas ascidiicola]
MKTNLLIRIPSVTGSLDSHKVVQWGFYTQTGERCGDLHLGTIEQLGAALQAVKQKDDDAHSHYEESVLLIGGLLCFYRELGINAGQKKHLHAALPYLVEEHLAQDIDGMHIVSGQPDKNLNVAVAAITHEIIQNLLALFERCGISPSYILPELQFLKSEDEKTTLFLDNDGWSLSRSCHDEHEREIVALNYDALPFVFNDEQALGLDSSVQERGTESQGDDPECVRLRFSDKEWMLEPSRLEEVSTFLTRRGFQVEQRPFQHSLLDYLADQFFSFRQSNRLVNFRQGSYRCSKKTNRFLRRWWPVAALAGMWLLVELGFTAAEGIVYQQQQAALWNESVNSYLTVFANDRQAQQALKRQQLSFNVKRLVENRLKNLDTPSELSPFLPMLQSVSTAMEKMGTEVGLQPDVLDFNQQSGILKLEVTADQQETVHRFIGHINAMGLNSQITRSTPEKEGIIAHISIRETAQK